MTTGWEHSRRCPRCGGLNDLDAEWCMQCFTRLLEPKKSIDMNAGAPGFGEIVGGGLDVVAGETHEGSDEGIAEAFAVTGGSVTWACGRCQHRNPIAANECAECGRAFTESARMISDSLLPKKTFRANLKALGYLSIVAVGMRLVAGLVSPWAAGALFGGVVLRGVVRFFRNAPN